MTKVTRIAGRISVVLLASFVFITSCAMPTGLTPPAIWKAENLLDEDSRLVGVTGKVLDIKDDLHLADYHRSAFVPTGTNRIFILLESKALEELEDQAKGGREITVSGTVTKYRGKNYLLLPPVMGGTTEGADVVPEDSRLIDRAGRVHSLKDYLPASEADRPLFVLKAGGDTYIILENQNLEHIERAGRRGQREVAISGTLTVYRGKNYLLLTRIAKDVF